MMRIGILSFFLLTSSFLISGESKKLIPVVMQLDWVYNAQFAGLYQAIEQGYYDEAGLDVELRKVDPNQKTVDAVMTEEKIIFASAEANVIMRAYNDGAPLVAVDAMMQANPMGWMYLKSSGIRELKDLEGKKVGIHPDGEKIIALVAAKNGIDLADFTLPHVNYDIQILIDGEIDAMQCYSIDEFVRLQMKTEDGGGVFLAKDYGYDTYSQVFFTKASTWSEQPEVVEKFLTASKKGWEYALDNPEETVALIIEDYSPKMDAEYLMESLALIEKLVRPEGEVMRAMDPSKWEYMQSVYVQYGVIPEASDLSALLAPVIADE